MLICGARISEIPVHLDWTEQNKLGKSRTSSVRIFNGILNGLFNSFIFRPYMFFWLIGLLTFAISLYVIVWIFINTYQEYPLTSEVTMGFEERLTQSVSEVYRKRPYSFVVGGISLIVSIQLLSLGFLSLQKKRYFDELFHLNSAIFKSAREK